MALCVSSFTNNNSRKARPLPGRLGVGHDETWPQVWTRIEINFGAHIAAWIRDFHGHIIIRGLCNFLLKVLLLKATNSSHQQLFQPSEFLSRVKLGWSSILFLPCQSENPDRATRSSSFLESSSLLFSSPANSRAKGLARTSRTFSAKRNDLLLRCAEVNPIIARNSLAPHSTATGVKPQW